MEVGYRVSEESFRGSRTIPPIRHPSLILSLCPYYRGGWKNREEEEEEEGNKGEGYLFLEQDIP